MDPLTHLFVRSVFSERRPPSRRRRPGRKRRLRVPAPIAERRPSVAR